MEPNKLIDDVLEKVPKMKETVEKVENATGKKIENVASEIGEKITDAIKNNDGNNQKGAIGHAANKLFGIE